MPRILGIDPGSRITGYGCVDAEGTRFRHVEHGILKLSATGGKQEISLEDRLLQLFRDLTEVIEDLRPQILVIEKVFFAKNALSALKLGQARGTAIVCGALHRLEVVEYSPAEVKQAIVGHGGAEKGQVARMVQMLVGRQKFETSDASDALALALCHAQILSSRRGGAWSALGAKPKRGRVSLAEAVGFALPTQAKVRMPGKGT